MRDTLPDRFLDVHRALFAHRHEQGRLAARTRGAAQRAAAAGVDADAVLAEVASGRPLATIKKEHTGFAEPQRLGRADVHRRRPGCLRPLHELPDGDGQLAVATVERVLDLLGWPELNEFKHTSIPR